MTAPVEPGPEAHWRAALQEGRILLQRARGSGTVFFPPRLAEPGTGDTDWEWVEAPALATVYAVTIVHPRPPKEPYNVVIVDFDGGGRMMGRVDNIAADAVRIGMQVAPRIVTIADEPAIAFEPVGQA